VHGDNFIDRLHMASLAEKQIQCVSDVLGGGWGGSNRAPGVGADFHVRNESVWIKR